MRNTDLAYPNFCLRGESRMKKEEIEEFLFLFFSVASATTKTDVLYKWVRTCLNVPNA